MTEGTQGQVLLGVAANAGLEPAVAGWLDSVGYVVKAIADAAESLHDDGVTLAQFAALLNGEDI